MALVVLGNCHSTHVLELELIQAHMAQGPMLRVEVGARALRLRSVSREEAPLESFTAFLFCIAFFYAATEKREGRLFTRPPQGEIPSQALMLLKNRLQLTTPSPLRGLAPWSLLGLPLEAHGAGTFDMAWQLPPTRGSYARCISGFISGFKTEGGASRF